jgi:hypothetical protein
MGVYRGHARGREASSKKKGLRISPLFALPLYPSRATRAGRTASSLPSLCMMLESPHALRWKSAGQRARARPLRWMTEDHFQKTRPFRAWLNLSPSSHPPSPSPSADHRRRQEGIQDRHPVRPQVHRRPGHKDLLVRRGPPQIPGPLHRAAGLPDWRVPGGLRLGHRRPVRRPGHLCPVPGDRGHPRPVGHAGCSGLPGPGGPGRDEARGMVSGKDGSVFSFFLSFSFHP